MYSEEDISSAVAAGVLSAEAANGLRAHVSALREMPSGDEESFRLVTSFNDIFVTIGVIILLIAVGAIGNSLTPSLANDNLMLASIAMMLPSALVAATAWFLAEIFTRRRGMALPSIVLLIAFVCSVFGLSLSLVMIPLGLIAGVNSVSAGSLETSGLSDALAATMLVILMLSAGALTVFAAWRHWRRFMVPITVAAGAAALVGSVIAAIAMAHDALRGDTDSSLAILPLVLIAGLATFAVAMRWDMSDRERTTRRNDVAFWLHLLAAPMIAHPLFSSLGVMDGGGSVGVAGALGVIAIYVVFGLVALAIDRRALLVSALAYVLAALAFLFDRFGAVELTFAFTALVIGSALLTLSAMWSPIRARVVAGLPEGLQMKLPVTEPATAPSPA